MSIPENYRQLSREQIASRFAGQERPRCHVQLIRLEESAPRVVFEGERELYLMWSDHAGGRGGKARKLKPDDPRRLALITVSGGQWAECMGDDIEPDGDCVVEDYLMRLYAADGVGPTIAERQQRTQAMAASLLGAIAGNFGELGATNVQIGDLLISTTTSPSGPAYVIQTTEKSLCPHCKQPIDLLICEDGERPTFYICFACRWVGQAGVGPVARLEAIGR